MSRRRNDFVAMALTAMTLAIVFGGVAMCAKLGT